MVLFKVHEPPTGLVIVLCLYLLKTKDHLVMIKLTLKLQHLFTGPNPHSSSSALVFKLNSDANIEEENALALWKRMHELYPDWISNPPLALQTSALVTVAEIIAHWSKGLLNSVRGFIEHSGAKPADEGAFLWLEYHVPALAERVLLLANAVIQREINDLPTLAEHTRQRQRFQQQCRRHHPDYQARILMEGARSKNIPFLPIVQGSRFWQFGWGKQSRVFFESASNSDGKIASMMAKSKDVTKRILNELGLPTPTYVLVSRVSDLAAAAKKNRWPCVVKPLDRGGGKGVTAGIGNLKDLQSAFQHARKYTSGEVMVEAFVTGEDYRLLVIDGELISAAKRIQPRVIGDGQHTVAELIDRLNQSRTSNLRASNYMRPVLIDSNVETQLILQQLKLENVPEKGQQVVLRSNANLSTGGSAVDVLAEIHPEIKAYAEMIAVNFGLGTAGIDYLTADISQTVSLSGGAFIEVNDTPGLETALAAGMSTTNLALKVLGDKISRIPVILMLLPQSLQHDLASQIAEMTQYYSWAWCCDGNAGIGSTPLLSDQLSPQESVHAALKNKSAEGVLIIWTEKELYKYGLPVDHVDNTIRCNLALPKQWQEVVDARSEKHQELTLLGDAVQLCQSSIETLS
jgi:cyanophycin synthetase